MPSLWSKTATHPRFPEWKGNREVEVLVVGGGITGILCAYMLKQAGAEPVLVEADRLCGGITKDTTAKLTLQHGLLYDRLIRTVGLEAARGYLEAQRDALRRYRRLCREMDCDYQECDAFVYARDDRDKLERELRALERVGQPADFVEELPLPLSTGGAIRVPHQAQFHPLKFLFGLK